MIHIASLDRTIQYLFSELKVQIKVEIDSWSCVFTSFPPWGRVVSSMIHIASLDHMIQYLFNELKVQIKVEIDSLSCVFTSLPPKYPPPPTNSLKKPTRTTASIHLYTYTLYIYNCVESDVAATYLHKGEQMTAALV